MNTPIRRIGVLTSGGDSPGVNACLRAVVRKTLSLGWEPWGVHAGFTGLLHDDVVRLTSRSVSHIIGLGGAILGSSRCEEFDTPQGLREAMRHVNEQGLDALVVIGGDGSMRGALALEQAGVPTVGLPATIENDVCGTDVSVGVDTALNTALDAIDRIKDTASSHEQAFLIEMMGRNSGYLTLMAGLAGGAEMVCIPEVPFTLEQVAAEVSDAYVRGKRHCIIGVAAGARPSAREIATYLEERQAETGFAVRLTMLGHIQRGGAPTARDRVLATRLGSAAVEQLANGQHGVLVGWVDEALAVTLLAEVCACTRGIDQEYLDLARVLAR